MTNISIDCEEGLRESIVRGVGVTASEKFLAELADKAFLKLWAYPNVFIDKLTHGKGDGKELCDLLVVCGDYIIIFSDKHGEFNEGIDYLTAWNRWTKVVINKSVNQLNGAIRWIEKFPERIFIDRPCKYKFPIKLPSHERRKILAIAVANGANSACKNYYGCPTGSFIIQPHKTAVTPDNFSRFSVGDVNPNGQYIHVFDEHSLQMVLEELDTVTDFIKYLEKREIALRGGLFSATGEDQLLAYYLMNLNTKKEHDFTVPKKKGKSPSLIFLDETFYEQLILSPQYYFKKEADKTSYVWDALINEFILNIMGNTGVQILDNTPSLAQEEMAVRMMALEDRFSRRHLAEALLNGREKATSVGRFARLIKCKQWPGRAYLLIFLNHNPDIFKTMEEYREVRASLLYGYCLATFKKHQDLELLIGIGLSVLEAGGHSEDLMVMDSPVWDDNLENEFKSFNDKIHPWDENRTKQTQLHDNEYRT